MEQELKLIKLNHSPLGEEGWIKFFTESPYVPNFLRVALVFMVHLMYCYSYGSSGTYNEPEQKIENMIKVYNKTNIANKDETKVAIVTGANTGIGFETARMLVRAGFHVIIACRSKTKALEAIKRIEKNCEPVLEGHKGKVQFLELDLTSFQSVRNFAKAFLDLDLSLHFLINNAGIMMLPKFELTGNNHEMQFQVNHLSHFLLIDLLLPKLKETKGMSKIINLSSIGNYGAGLNLLDYSTLDEKSTYDPNIHYFKTKAANIMTTYKLHRMLKDSNQLTGTDRLLVYACHPGVVNTELTRYTSPNGSSDGFVETKIMKSSIEGALTTLRLVFLSPEQLESDARFAKCVDASKFTEGEPIHHLYYSDELPMTPIVSTLDKKSQDNLWDLSKFMVA